MAPSRAAASLLGAALVVALSGCTAFGDLSGIWRASGPTADPRMPADPATGLGVGVELYLGHYGPGAAGVLRYFETDEFLVPLDAAAPVGECACAYLERARWERDASTLVFEVEGCLPRHADDGALRVRGRLESIDGELVGYWSIDTEAPDGGVVSHLVPLTFSEHRGIGDATDEELRCASADAVDAGDAGDAGDAFGADDADGTP